VIDRLPPNKSFRGTVHRFDNNRMKEAKALCVITPAAIGPQYSRESAEVIIRALGGPLGRTKMAEIMRRRGLTRAPPPASELTVLRNWFRKEPQCHELRPRTPQWRQPPGAP